MAKYRHRLPQLTDATYLTDGGIETTLIFKKGVDLPYFAAFTLLEHAVGRQLLLDYYDDYLRLGRARCGGFILESPTWRANPDWIEKLGYSPRALADFTQRAIILLEGLRGQYERADFPIVISGCIGPRGDGYAIRTRMETAAAEAYHGPQVQAFAESNADLITAVTMNYTEEALGIIHAAKRLAIPVVISYTVETDGRLPSGESLEEAIVGIDQETDAYPAYFMINCAHPMHFRPALTTDQPWTARIRGIRANASTKSHAELDESTSLDEGDKALLARAYRQLKSLLPNFNIIGGCCGTDHTHIEHICEQWFAEPLSEPSL